MIKRIEKVVENFGDIYEVYKECKHHYYVIDENQGMLCLFKNKAKVVSEKEVLEFDIDELSEKMYNLELKEDVTPGSSFMVLKFDPDINLHEYDIKLIATPKEKDIEYWKNNAEENYMTTPISVLKYIGKLEKLIKSKE